MAGHFSGESIKEISVTIPFLTFLKAFRPKKSEAVLLTTIMTFFEVRILGRLMLFLTVFGTRVNNPY